jgi:heat shock protein HtpX
MGKVNFHDQISKNKRDSLVLGSAVFFILLGLVYVISQILTPGASIVFLVFGTLIMILYIYGTYNYGDKVVLAATKAKPIEDDDRKYIHLINVVDGLSIAAGIPKPKLYVIESDEINAFATGKNPKGSSIAVTTGLLKNLKRDEIEGVIGHEMSHIKNYDIRFATFVAVLVGLVAILSDLLIRSFWYGGGRDRDERNKLGILILLGFVLAIFAPILVRIVQFAVSRKREFLADAKSVELTRYPEGLASALEKIMKINQGKMKVSEAVSHLFFADPNKSPLDSLYATHPPLEERIKILRNM